MKLLSQLSPGERASVCALKATGLMKRRLMDMGLVVGTAVTMVGKAPLGDPLEIRLRGYHLSLRQSDAEHICVTVSNSPQGGLPCMQT